MALFATASRTIVIKASRETIGLVVVASAMACGLAYEIHSHPAPTPPAPVQRDWTGELAGGAPDTTPAQTPFNSADLVVPSAQLALPPLPTRSPAVKRGCDDTSCAKVPLPPPARRQIARADAPPRVPTKDQSLLSKFNPLNHVPDLSTIGKPFNYAGDVVSGWIKRF